MYVTYKSDAVVFSFPSALFDGIFLYVDIVKSRKREGRQKKPHTALTYLRALFAARSQMRKTYCYQRMMNGTICIFNITLRYDWCERG